MAEAEWCTIAELDARVAGRGAGGVPLLVFRLPALERTAWRNGLRAARSIERRATAAFAAAAARVLRAGDVIAHDRGSDAFAAALLAPTRDGHRFPAPLDVRSALARIAASIEGLTRLDVDAGWTHYDGECEARFDDAVARALERGRQERERYAFFSAVGHELRTPLASIRGYLETLLGDDTDADTRRRFVRIAHGEALRLTRLLEGMFEISLLDLSATLVPVADGALDRAVAAAVDAIGSRAAQRGIDLRCDTVPAVPVAIDADRLTLVLINLIDNAIKHGRQGGRVDVRAALDSPRTVTLDVDDDGPGIAAQERERLFVLGARGATPADGSGIGLALVRLILERAGGRVDVSESSLGGVRFRVTIPRCDANGSRKTRRRGIM